MKTATVPSASAIGARLIPIAPALLVALVIYISGFPVSATAAPGVAQEVSADKIEIYRRAAEQGAAKQAESDYRKLLDSDKVMTHEVYERFLSALSNDRKNDPVMFLVRSKKDILGHLSGLDTSKSNGVFMTNADYNEAVLASVVAVEEGFPILESTMHNLTIWTSMVRCANDSEKALVQSILVTVVGEDTILKKRIGLPHAGDGELRDIKLESDDELLTRYSKLDPNNIFREKKWPGARPKLDREKRWADIEKDPKTMTEAGANVMLDMLSMKGNKAGENVFSDPYFTAEALHMLSTVGNGFSIDNDDLKEFRRRCNLAAARTKSPEEFQFLTTFYGLLLRGDQEARKKGK